MCDGLFDKACGGQIGARARKEKEIELEFNSFSQGRSSNLKQLCEILIPCFVRRKKPWHGFWNKDVDNWDEKPGICSLLSSPFC